LFGSQDVVFTGVGQTIFTVDSGGFSEVDGNYVSVDTAKTNDLTTTTDIFNAVGVVIASVTEIQDKHCYVMLDSSGNMKLMIIPDAEMEGSSNVTANNPELYKDYYSGSPINWDSTKKGYYKTISSTLYRLIGHVFVNGSNQVEYFYELGNRYKYKDLESHNVGGLFTEFRFLREHPGCFIGDGSTITNMATDYPVLFDRFGSNVLPDMDGRVGRNIEIGGSRVIRDTQEDAFQGHRHNFIGSGGGGSGSPATPNSADANSATNIQYNNPTGYGVKEAIIGGYGAIRNDTETRMKNYAQSVQIVKG